MKKPLSTSLVSTEQFKDADIDTIARRVFSMITDPELAAPIEKHLSEFYGQPVTLATAYDSQAPLRVFPMPPVIDVSAAAAPLPENPSLADLRRWTLTWNVIADFAAEDSVGTMLVDDEARTDLPRVEASAFERAILAFDGSPESVRRIGEHAIEPHPPVGYVALDGPAGGSASFDIVEQPRMGVRATVVRNASFPADCRYAAAVTSAPVSASIDRTDQEFDLERLLASPDASLPALLEPLKALVPERVAIYFQPDAQPMPMPVLLVIESWEANEIANVLTQWWASQQNAEGRYVLDVSARGLRLRLAVKARL